MSEPSGPKARIRSPRAGVHAAPEAAAWVHSGGDEGSERPRARIAEGRTQTAGSAPPSLLWASPRRRGRGGVDLTPAPNPPTHPGAAGVTQRRRPAAAKPSTPDSCHTPLRRRVYGSPFARTLLRPRTPGRKSKGASPSRQPGAARRCGARGKGSPPPRAQGQGGGWGARLICHTAKTLERKPAAAAGRLPVCRCRHPSPGGAAIQLGEAPVPRTLTRAHLSGALGSAKS